MVAWCKFAAIDFNQRKPLEQAKTKSRDGRYNVCFSKIKNTWSAKPIKDLKSPDVFSNLVDLMEKSDIEKKKLAKIELPCIPRNIVSDEKPDKKDIVKKQKLKIFNLMFDYFCNTVSYHNPLFTFFIHKCFHINVFFIFVYSKTL